MIFLILFFQFNVFAQMPVTFSSETFQLQKLVVNSEQQVKSLKQLLKQKKYDAATLDKATRILERMSLGIDKSIEAYKGTAVYESAILKLQAQNDYAKTYKDFQNVGSGKTNVSSSASGQAINDLVQFQKDSVRANLSDLHRQEKLHSALQSAEPGFVPKIEAQAQIGQWQASTRLSAQMTELLTAVLAMREEIRLWRSSQMGAQGLETLVKGSELQNQIQREGGRR